ncbi:MAG: GNAT family N-acetyltransferase [Nocardioides sp.]|nr:GNAT family N-acetyltransferase [Nocardioides sp.]
MAPQPGRPAGATKQHPDVRCREAGTSPAIGYYASTTYRLDLDEAARAFGAGKRAYPGPAVLLARLAVTKAHQRYGVGTALLIDALTQMAAASMAIGFEVVVVDAIDSSAATFYRRAGFTPFEDHPLEFYLPAKDLRATFSR